MLGYIRDGNGLENLFQRSNDIYTQLDFSHYGSIIHRLKDYVKNAFGIQTLYFTAPTFITRSKQNNYVNKMVILFKNK